MSVSEKSLATIKDQHLKPVSVSLVVVKHLLIWSGMIVSLVLTSVSWSFVLLLVNETDWEVRGRLALGFWELALIIMPTIWLFGVGIFMILAFYFWRATARSYRWRIWLAGALEVGLSLVLGWVLFQFGLPDYFDDFVTPEVHQVSTRQAMIWNRPDRGLLSGRIVEVSPVAECCSFEIEDWQNNFWQITASSTAVRPSVKILVGQNVKLLGEQEADHIFMAKEIRPWSTSRKMRPGVFERKNIPLRITR